ncbi:hypothetical protein GCM10009841_17630 [Microlunatus panaciterrae]
MVTSTAAGCSLTDPRIDTSGLKPRPIPTPSPTPSLPGSAAGADTEQALARLATAVLDSRDAARLGAQVRMLVGLVLADHRDHVVALRSPQPTSRPVPTGSPSPTTRTSPGTGAGKAATALRRLVAGERAAARLHRAAADATSGYTCLLWGSLAAAAGQYADALESGARTAAPPKPQQRRPLVPVTDLEAIQALLRQSHAMVYGYQLALGKLSGARADRAAGRLAQHRVLRDRLVDLLNERSADVPAAEPAYVPPIEVSNASRAVVLLRLMETRFLPFVGQWVAAAATGPTRSLALDELSAATLSARAWGAALQDWPGWPS